MGLERIIAGEGARVDAEREKLGQAEMVALLITAGLVPPRLIAGYIRRSPVTQDLVLAAFKRGLSFDEIAREVCLSPDDIPESLIHLQGALEYYDMVKPAAAPITGIDAISEGFQARPGTSRYSTRNDIIAALRGLDEIPDELTDPPRRTPQELSAPSLGEVLKRTNRRR